METKTEIYIKCDVKGKLVRIVLADIFYIEAAQNYVIIHLTNDKHRTYLTVKEIKEVLDSAIYVQVHKSFIINRFKISSIENGSIILVNGRRLFIGAKYREAFWAGIYPLMVVSNRH